MTRRILVIDDDDLSRSLLRDILTPAGYEILEASDGESALELMKTQRVDLIITDRAMPGMGGLGLLKVLKERKVKTPVLMVSGFGEESFWAEAIGLGAVDYLLKPFKAEEVMKIIRKCLKPEKTK